VFDRWSRSITGPAQPFEQLTPPLLAQLRENLNTMSHCGSLEETTSAPFEPMVEQDPSLQSRLTRTASTA
jgi:hypothetical protein